MTEAPGFLAAFSILAYGLVALIEFAGNISHLLAAALYLLIVLFALVMIYGTILQLNNKRPLKSTIGVDFPFTIVSVFLYVVGFGGLCQQLYFVFGGFTGGTPNFWPWLRFSFDWVVDNVLFNLSQIWNWQISGISATETWSRALVFAYNLILELGAIVVVLRYYPLVRESWRERQPVRQTNYAAFLLSRFGVLFANALWAIPTFVFVGAIVTDELSITSSLLAIRFGAPVVLSVWLAWESLRALAVKGALNKLIALLGIAAGVWLVHLTWGAFVAFLQH